MRERLEKFLKPFRRSERDVPSPVAHMFIQDVHSWIMPFRTRKGGRQLEVTFEGDTNDVMLARRTLQHMGRNSHAYRDVAESVCDVVREIVQHMLWRGYAAFEIADEPTDVPISPGRSHFRAEDFDKYYPLEPLTGDRLVRMPGLVLSLRRSPRARWDRDRRLINVRRSRRIWFVNMPRMLGGRTGYRSLIRKLDRFPQVFPAWSTEAVVKQQQDVRFDVTEYARLRAAYYSRSTGNWSWTGRDTSLNYQTEFFLFYRTVTFRYALAVLREHVLEGLNRLFRERLGLNAKIVVKGLPSSDEVLAIRDRMERAELSIGEAFDLVSF